MELSILKAAFDTLDHINDPRSKRGIRHPAPAIVKLMVFGFISGKTSIEQIAALARESWEYIRTLFGFTYKNSPDATTLSRLLVMISRTQLEMLFEDFVSKIIGNDTFIASVDGKAARNVKDEDGNILMAVNVFAHELKIALAQWAVETKKGEPTVLAKMLEPLFNRYPGLRILTGDAYYAGRSLCEAIVDLKRDYIVQIKGDQPKIQKAIKSWVKEEVHDAKKKPDATEKKKSNKKDEIITWKLWIEKGNIANHIREELNFPSVMQVAYLEKTILNLSTQEKTIESGYYITSAKQKILPPDNFLLGIRNHWGIENSLHHILDRTMNEDKQRSSTHEQGMNLKILRNLVITQHK
jgi:hypothetical protein